MLPGKIGFVWKDKKSPVFALAIFLLAGLLVAISGGYYPAVSTKALPEFNEPAIRQIDRITMSDKPELNPEIVKKGERLFYQWCVGCHHANSTQTKVGPGLKGILKRETLPVSGRPATPENIRRQLLTPYRLMTPHTHFSEEEVEQIIEFLKTL